MNRTLTYDPSLSLSLSPVTLLVRFTMSFSVPYVYIGIEESFPHVHSLSLHSCHKNLINMGYTQLTCALYAR